MNNLQFAKNVLLKEADAILSISSLINDDFEKLAIFLANSTARVITTGVGKSGNIAQKIASTLSSTGTPSLFLHPTDASHGDLGMIQNNDIIIALSVSGNTVEMINLLNFANSNKNPIVCFTCNKDSMLYKYATYKFLFPKLKEACNIELAPSTSSTAMLAFGDALALTISKIKNFTKENFKKYHPGGALGEMIK